MMLVTLACHRAMRSTKRKKTFTKRVEEKKRRKRTQARSSQTETRRWKNQSRMGRRRIQIKGLWRWNACQKLVRQIKQRTLTNTKRQRTQ